MDNGLIKKHRKMTYDLPEDLLPNIFKRLAERDLIRCRCVQKSWYYFIQTPKFIALHSDYQGITWPVEQLRFFDTLYARSLTRRFDDCPLWHAVSNGLKCMSLMFDIHHYNPDIYLWNPVIQSYDTLPPSPLPRFSLNETFWRALAFGFVPETNDHVVVHVVKYHRLTDVKSSGIDRSVLIGVYNLSTNSWKKIRRDRVIIRAISTHDVAFVNGAAYWIGITWENYKILVCFDTKNDMLRDDLIFLPDYLDEDRGCYDYTIYPHGQSIAYFLFNSQSEICDMWVLKGQMNELSWEKEMSVCMNKNAWTDLLGTRRTGEPGLARFCNLISKDLDN